MAATLHAKYLGNLDCECTHVPTGDTVRSNPPFDNHGTCKTFSPTDLFLSGLATCMMTTIANSLENYGGCSIDGMEMSVDKTMHANPRYVETITVDVVMPDFPYTDAQKASIMHDIRHCTMCRSINPAIKLTVNFTWKN